MVSLYAVSHGVGSGSSVCRACANLYLIMEMEIDPVNFIGIFNIKLHKIVLEFIDYPAMH